MHIAPDQLLLDEAGKAAGIELVTHQVTPVTGGDISNAFRCADTQGRPWFIKLNQAAFSDVFAAEEAGLQALSQANLRVPRAMASGVTAGHAWLLLEWLDLTSGDTAAARQLGVQLADLHRVTADCFGAHRDNYIGSTSQPNPDENDWSLFYGQHRLQHQLDIAAGNGASADVLDKGRQLVNELPSKLADYTPSPSLLHGDLWGGNWAVLPDGVPVIFDPAVYFGDRETDLAMTRLFGGFSADFYAAYMAAWPLEPGHEYRCTLYQLYHVLNHFNLFGGAYLEQAARMLETLLSEEP